MNLTINGVVTVSALAQISDWRGGAGASTPWAADDPINNAQNNPRGKGDPEDGDREKSGSPFNRAANKHRPYEKKRNPAKPNLIAPSHEASLQSVTAAAA